MMDLTLNSLLLAAEATEEAVATEAGGTSPAIKFLIVLAVLLVPFLLGQFIAKALKLQDLGGRLGFVLVAATLGLTPFVWNIWEATQVEAAEEEQVEEARESAVVRGMKNSIRLGIDLAGGTNLVFQAYSDDPEKPITSDVMDRMVGAVGRRINPSGTEETVVRKVGADRIEVIIPGADPERVRQVKKLITKLGSLEFAILANRRYSKHRPLIARAEDLPDDQQDLRDASGTLLASWRSVGVDPSGELEDVGDGPDDVVREVTREVIVDGQRVSRTVPQFLVIFGEPDSRVTGDYLTRARPTLDESGRLAVAFNFNQEGAFKFQALTSEHKPRQSFQFRLAILLDNQIHSAPSVKATISDSGIITGDFTQQEVNELVDVLNAGALDVPLKREPISEFTVSPLIGEDVIRKGMRAFLYAGILVLIFMAVYYLIAGLIADACLLLNLILIMGTMSLIDATFTLPGLAGLVLTVGMAVDANVLIFERIREERRRNASLRLSIRDGFGKALSTIVDANVTTLITAVILFYIGTDQVRGFAVTLFIGIVMSMFSALFAGRLLFDILERKRWISDVKMNSLIGATSWNFLGKRRAAFVVSAVLIVSGLVSLVSRGQQNLDIDFTGGTMVTFRLTEPQTTDTVRDVLEEEFGTNITLERLQLDEQDTATEGRYFRLRTTLRDADLEENAESGETRTVQHMINDAFEDTPYKLRRVEMSVDNLKEIPKPAEGEEEATVASDFAGGHEFDLVFTSEGDNELTTTTVLDYLVAELTDIDEDEKYTEPENLFEIEGVEGSGLDAAVGEVATYSRVHVKTFPALSQEELTTLLGNMQQTMRESPIFDEVNSFASSVASEMQVDAILALLASLVAIIAYIWFRFQSATFGLAAVAALVHDVLVVLGMVAVGGLLSNTPVGGILLLNDFKINLPMIAAFLTIVGYSLNDTIVVFDRIREVRGKNPALTEDMVNFSLNQTLARTLLTSLTTFLVVGVLYALGGEGIHGFAYCLVIGVIIGTYSSIYVASPVLLWLMNRSSGARAVAAGKSPKQTVSA